MALHLIRGRNVQITYLLVAALVVAVISGWVGYWNGVDMERGRQAIERQHVINTAVASAYRDTEAETERRTAQAIRDARRAAASRSARLKGQEDVRKEIARVECRMPSERVRNINAAIDAANASDDPAGIVPVTLP